MKTKSTIALLTLLCLVGCGGKSGGGGGGAGAAPDVTNRPGDVEGEVSRPHVESNRELPATTPGTYYAVLRPVNFHSNGFIPYGAANFDLQSEQMKVNVSLDDDQPVQHRQALHAGTRCPTLVDDTNGDGFVDFDEAQRVVGQVQMYLDSDLNADEQSTYLKGPAMTYEKIATGPKVQEKKIGLPGRVVLVHGTRFQPTFPASLAAFEGEEPHLSLPVVCGVLEKIE